MTVQAPIDIREFRNALGSFTTGVTIVTTRDQDGHDVGMTANSFNSVSLDPPLVLWSLAKSSGSLPAFANAEYFAVHILAADQEPLSNVFAKRGADKFAGLDLGRGHGGVPLLGNCSARFECRTAYRYEGGDHEIIVGEVVLFENHERPPLAFQSGAYALAVKKPHPPSATSPTRNEPESSFSKDFLVYLLGCAHSMLLTKARNALARHALCDAEYFVLSILGVDDRRTVSELDALLSYTGHRVTPELVDELERRNYIAVHLGDDGQSHVRLTEYGRKTVVELVSVSKVVEEDALAQIDYSEAHMLKHLLKRVIRNAGNEMPGLWKSSQ